MELFRPVGDAELALIRDSGWSAFAPRQSDQPIFYPVLEEDYAIPIARDWNTRDGGRGYVLKFQVDRQYISRYEPQTVSARIHREYWIPAEDFSEFNRNILGRVEVIHSFGSEKPDEVLNERLTASSIPPVTAWWQTIVRLL